jgi:hypothetical protein
MASDANSICELNAATDTIAQPSQSQVSASAWNVDALSVAIVIKSALRYKCLKNLPAVETTRTSAKT